MKQIKLTIPISKELLFENNEVSFTHHTKKI